MSTIAYNLVVWCLVVGSWCLVFSVGPVRFEAFLFFGSYDLVFVICFLLFGSCYLFLVFSFFLCFFVRNVPQNTNIFSFKPFFYFPVNKYFIFGVVNL
jgi:hypothetical protein